MGTWNPEKYLHAWNFAAIADDGQCVPGSTVAYIHHLGSVVIEVMTAIAFLLFL